MTNNSQTLVDLAQSVQVEAHKKETLMQERIEKNLQHLVNQRLDSMQQALSYRLNKLKKYQR